MGFVKDDADQKNKEKPITTFTNSCTDHDKSFSFEDLDSSNIFLLDCLKYSNLEIKKNMHKHKSLE